MGQLHPPDFSFKNAEEKRAHVNGNYCLSIDIHNNIHIIDT